MSDLTIDRLDQLAAMCADEEQREILTLARERLFIKRNHEQVEAPSIKQTIADAHGTAGVGIARAREHWNRGAFHNGTRATIEGTRDFLKCEVADTPYYRGYRAELQRLIDLWEPRVQEWSTNHPPPAPERERLRAENERLRKALQGLLNVIAADALIPETVSYMQQARAALSPPAEPGTTERGSDGG